MINPDDSNAGELARPDIPLPRLYERDIDVLLPEELLFGRPVQSLILDALKLPHSAQFVSGRLSVVDETGETDVVVDLRLGEEHGTLLIENKIDAAFQPRQPERYRLRAEAMTGGRAFCVLVAPSGYSWSPSAEFSFFDAVVSYEDVAAAIQSEDTPRSRDRAAMLLRAVGQARKAYVVIPSEIVGDFWSRVYRIASDEFPELLMKSPGEKGSRSSWLIFKGDLPAKVTIDWKVEKGTVGLSFWKGASVQPEASDLGPLEGTATWRLAGTTRTIELRVANPPGHEWTEMNNEDIRVSLAAAAELLRYYRQQLHR